MKKKIFNLLKSYGWLLGILIMSTVAAVIIAVPVLASIAFLIWLFQSRIIAVCTMGLIAFLVFGLWLYKNDIP